MCRLSILNRTSKSETFSQSTASIADQKNGVLADGTIASFDTSKDIIVKPTKPTKTPTYRLRDSDDSTCILLKTDSVIEVCLKSVLAGVPHQRCCEMLEGAHNCIVLNR